MKKSTLEALYHYLNGYPSLVDVTTLREEVNAEYERLTAKAEANAQMYEEAKAVVLAALTDTPQTALEIFEAVADDLPDDFTSTKVSYALAHRWEADVVKHDNGRKPNTYTKRV